MYEPEMYLVGACRSQYFCAFGGIFALHMTIFPGETLPLAARRAVSAMPVGVDRLSPFRLADDGWGIVARALPLSSSLPPLTSSCPILIKSSRAHDDRAEE